VAAAAIIAAANADGYDPEDVYEEALHWITEVWEPGRHDPERLRRAGNNRSPSD
jgi:hypothetical protein